jgi:hypothetical protein
MASETEGREETEAVGNEAEVAITLAALEAALKEPEGMVEPTKEPEVLVVSTTAASESLVSMLHFEIIKSTYPLHT